MSFLNDLIDKYGGEVTGAVSDKLDLPQEKASDMLPKLAPLVLGGLAAKAKKDGPESVGELINHKQRPMTFPICRNQRFTHNPCQFWARNGKRSPQRCQARARTAVLSLTNKTAVITRPLAALLGAKFSRPNGQGSSDLANLF